MADEEKQRGRDLTAKASEAGDASLSNEETVRRMVETAQDLLAEAARLYENTNRMVFVENREWGEPTLFVIPQGAERFAVQAAQLREELGLGQKDNPEDDPSFSVYSGATTVEANLFHQADEALSRIDALVVAMRRDQAVIDDLKGDTRAILRKLRAA